MKSLKPSSRSDRVAWKRIAWGGPFLIAGILATSGCKNTPQGPVPIWNAPTNSTSPQSDPLFGPAGNAQPPNQVAPPTAGINPTAGTVGAALGSPQPSGPLPPLAAPHTMSSPAALASGATGQLTNPRDPYSNQPISTPSLSAPIVNTSAPGPATTNQPAPIQLRQPEPAPSNNWSSPPAGGFNPGNASSPAGGLNSVPPPAPPPGSINSNANFLQQSQNGLNSLQNNISNTAQQSQKDLVNMANSANATANQYKQGAVQTQQDLFNQGKQLQSNITNSANSSMDRLKQQLAQQGQAVDGVMQSTLTSLDESLRRQGMVWQNVQKQADGTWKSTASFADPNNPTNRTTREVVASTPEAAMRALLGDASSAPKAPPTGIPPLPNGR